MELVDLAEVCPTMGVCICCVCWLMCAVTIVAGAVYAYAACVVDVCCYYCCWCCVCICCVCWLMCAVTIVAGAVYEYAACVVDVCCY